ncbi:MAG: putative toxin-antitoxin system toxin component, PIN family [Ignavibacteriales bacterium]
MIRVVADTNVYISALNFGGTADEVLALGRKQEILIFISPSILKEIREVLIRKFRWSTKDAQEAITGIGDFTELVHPKERIDLIKDDEPDNRILECAMEAKANFIITGDRHIQKLRKFQGILIFSPREFLEIKM